MNAGDIYTMLCVPERLSVAAEQAGQYLGNIQ